MLKYIRWIWNNTIGIRLNMLGRTLAGLAIVAIDLSLVWLCKEFIDVTIRIGTNSDVWSMVALLVGVLLTGILIRQLYFYYGVKAKTQQSNDIRLRIYQHLMYRKLYDGNKFHSGELVSRLEQDIESISNSVATMLPEVLVDGCKLVGAFLMLRVMDSTLAWLLLVVTPIFIVAGKLISHHMRALTHDIRAQESRVQSLIQESLELDAVLRTLGTTPWMIGKVSDHQKDLLGKVNRRTKFTATTRIILSASFGIGYLLAFIWGGLQLRDGVITIGVMTSFLQLVGQLQQPIVGLLNLVPQFIHATASIDRLNELENLELESGGVAVAMLPCDSDTANIKIDNVSFAYDNDMVLARFSRIVPSGSRIAIEGRTGAGKTTLFRLLLGLIKPDAGSITISYGNNEINVGPSTREWFVFVPQGNTLMSGTIRSNLLLAKPDANDTELCEALHTAMADFVFQLPDGLDTQLGERGQGLSEGQAQRIAIARGILRKGPVMLLDEISSSLDEDTERELFSRLFARCGSRTILMITHRPMVAALCNESWKL